MTTTPTRGSHRPTRPKAATTPRLNSPARPKAKAGAEAGVEPGQVTLAVVMGAHGIGGEVKLKLFTSDLARYKTLNGGSLTLTSLRGNIARIAQTADRTAAEALRGTMLTVSRADLPPLAEGEYYHADLIGLRVVTPDGAAVGRVVAVENFGAGDLLEIERPDGKTFMVPLRPEAVPEWNAEQLIVDPAFAES